MKRILLPIALAAAFISACTKQSDAPKKASAMSSNNATVKQDTVHVYTEGNSANVPGVIGSWAFFCEPDIWLPSSDYTGYKVVRSVWTLHKLSGRIKWQQIKQIQDGQGSKKNIADTQSRDLKVVFDKDYDLIPGWSDQNIPEYHYTMLLYKATSATSDASMTVTLDSIYFEHNGVPCYTNIDGNNHSNRTINF